MNKKAVLSLILLMNFGFIIGMDKSLIDLMDALNKKQEFVQTGMASFYYRKNEHKFFALEDELSQEREMQDRLKDKKRKAYITIKEKLSQDEVMQSIESYFNDWKNNPKSTKIPSFKVVVEPSKSCLKQRSSYLSSSSESGKTTPEIVSPEGNYYLRK